MWDNGQSYLQKLILNKTGYWIQVKLGQVHDELKILTFFKYQTIILLSTFNIQCYMSSVIL